MSPPSPRPKFSQFHAVFWKIWQNHMLAPQLEGWHPLLRGILDLPLVTHLTAQKQMLPQTLRVIGPLFNPSVWDSADTFRLRHN